jgi:hypothetical protein
MKRAMKDKLDMLNTHFEVYYENVKETVSNMEKGWLKPGDINISKSEWDRMGDLLIFEEFVRCFKRKFAEKIKDSED